MSIESTTEKAIKKIQMVLLAELPEPSCQQKKEHWRWQVEQVKKSIAQRLWPENNGVQINVTV